MDANHAQCPSCGKLLLIDLCPQCTLSALSEGAFARESKTGPSIPGLTVHEEVGEGGFGIVYRATQVEAIQRPVALKVLKPGVDTRQVLRRFEVERQALALLEHPNIARFYQAGETGSGYPWFTMEFIQGEPISDALAGQELAPLVATFLMVCRAVAFAHCKGVIHRDLKPSNILVTPDGIPKVIDFGVAKATGHTPGMTLYTADEITAGTPAYMSPEKGTDIDPRSDVFALGAILFELLTGTLPPESGDFPPPSSLAIRQLPKSLDTIVRKAVESKPNDRYQSVKEFAADLRRFQNGEKIRISRKSKLKWLLPIAALLVVGAFAFWPSTNIPELVISKSEIVRLQSSGHPAHIALSHDGKTGLAIFRINGRAILFDARDGRELGSVSGKPFAIGYGRFSEDGNRFVIGFSNSTFRFYSAKDATPVSPAVDCADPGNWIVNIRHLTVAGTKEPIVLTTTKGVLRAWSESGTKLWVIHLAGPAYRFAVSPDRATALIGSPRGKLNIIDLTTATNKVIKDHTAHIYEIKYSPDGQSFACASFDDTATVWDSSGKLRYRFQHKGKVKDLDFSPDGKLLATPSFDGTVRIWDLSNGRERFLLHHQRDALSVSFSPDGAILASGGRDNMPRLWDPKSGKALRQAFDCGGAIDRIRFSKCHDGSLNILVQTDANELLVIPFSTLN